MTGMALGDTSRKPVAGHLPATDALPTSVATSFPYMLETPNANMPAVADSMSEPMYNPTQGYTDSENFTSQNA